MTKEKDREVKLLRIISGILLNLQIGALRYSISMGGNEMIFEIRRAFAVVTCDAEEPRKKSHLQVSFPRKRSATLSIHRQSSAVHQRG